tara:strand:- start:21 stop:1283 length:1263 start_codon:yes stop_codon:yes gene_type:complete
MKNEKTNDNSKARRCGQKEILSQQGSGNTSSKPNKRQHSPSIRYFSMFTGVGGFELGIKQANDLRRIQQTNTSREGSSKNNSKQRGLCDSRKFSCVGFSEIDKYASELLKQKFPNTKNFGDCTKLNTDELPEFDFLCGGFPCQSFSIAGKRRGFQDTRGTMFFEIARILKAKRPKTLLLENVKGLLNHNKGETFKVILQTLDELGYEVQWMVLNSKFFGVPQNRERVFIVGSLRGTSRPEILPFREINGENYEQGSTYSYAIDSNYYKGAGNKAQRTMVEVQGCQAQRVFNTEGIAPSLRGLGGGQGAKTGLYAMRSYPRTNNPEQDKKIGRFQNMEMRKDGVTNTLSSVQKDNLWVENARIRRLTPTECERLQGFPEGHTEGFSDTQRYKMMGNAVTVNVVQAIMSKMFVEVRQGEQDG